MKQQSIVIDGRMFGSAFTGIGCYTEHMVYALANALPAAKIQLFLGHKETQTFPGNITSKIAEEKIYSLGEQTSFLRKLQKTEANLTFFPHFNVPLFFHRPFVAVIHDLTILKYPGKKMGSWFHQQAYKLVLRHTLRKAKQLIAVSEYTKQEILRFMPEIPAKKITVIPNGVNTEIFQKREKKREQKYQKLFGDYFLISGVWREHKNIVGAITAFDLFRKYGGKGSLVITGKNDPYYPEVKQAVEQSPYGGDIFFSGFVEASCMPSLLRASTALLFPSFSEGFGLPVLEAFAAKVPVVCSKTTSLPEVGGDACLYCDPYDPEDIALKMVDALHPKTRDLLVQKGHERLEHFSWKKSGSATVEVLKNCLKEL